MSNFRTNWFQHPRFADAAGGGRTIKSGEQGVAVQILQRALLTLGYSLPISTQKSGNPDGIFGAETDARVRDFQKKALPQHAPDGKVGPLTLTSLDQALVGKPAPQDPGIIWGRAPANVPGAPSEVDLGTVFGNYSAVKQMHDMACWAACLSFWAKFCGGGRPRITQGRINALYGHLTESGGGPKMGGISTGGYEQILTDRATPENVLDPSELDYRWKGLVRNPYDVSGLTYDWLRNNTSGSNRALLFGYTINGASHINVIGHYDFEGTSLVWAMEPWDGRFKLREIDYYRQSTKSFFAYPN